MPIYEYRCTKCGHRFERIQSYSAEDVKLCPICGAAVERLISAPVAHFKGSGFYSTDYAPKPSPAAKSNEASGSGGDGKSGDGKSGESKSGETTPAAKPEKSAAKAESAPAASSSE